MKELSIEEKAKRYDEAIKVAADIKAGIATYITDGTPVIDAIFPELKESDEGERIRKELIEYFRWNVQQILNNFDNKDVLAWLEKQRGQKTIDEIAKDVCKNRASATTFLKSAGIMNEKGELAEQYRQDEQKSYASKTMNEKGDFDNGFTRMMEKEQTAAWSEKDKEMSRFIGNAITADDSSVYLKSKGIEVIDAHVWLDELKDRVQPQPKQDWSEEDEKIWKEISDMLWEGYTQSCSNFTWDDIRDWVNPKIKSIRSQNTWKPSDEQIEALDSATENCAYSEYQDCLRELIGQLKKLREE